MVVQVKDADRSLAIRVGRARQIVLNGKPVAHPVIRDGMYYPYAAMPLTVTADDADAFQRVTQGNEWQEVADPKACGNSYTVHETDPGRNENGNYTLRVPESGRYAVEVSLPAITMTPSDRVEYSVPAPGKPAAMGGAVVASRQGGGTMVVTLNQQAKCGWVRIGEFDLKKGMLTIGSRNVTPNDGIYFLADAVRIVKK
jgi:hypothetical protein